MKAGTPRPWGWDDLAFGVWGGGFRPVGMLCAKLNPGLLAACLPGPHAKSVQAAFLTLATCLLLVFRIEAKSCSEIALKSTSLVQTGCTARLPAAGGSLCQRMKFRSPVASPWILRDVFRPARTGSSSTLNIHAERRPIQPSVQSLAASYPTNPQTHPIESGTNIRAGELIP